MLARLAETGGAAMLTPAEYTAKKKREQARERQRRFRERHPEINPKKKKSDTLGNEKETGET